MGHTKVTKGDLRVWWIAQVGQTEGFHVPVKTPQEAALLLNTLAEYDAHQYLQNVKPDYSNAGGLVEFDGEDWVDWIDPATDQETDPLDLYPQPTLGWCIRLNDL